ncbi:MAG: tetratricopeptide repeat protein [Tannerella sp.]|nr:tetratricopeptide repeat protein [Tannerella sp.]
MIFNRKQTGKAITIRNPVFIGLLVLFTSGVVYLYFKKPDNALIHAAKGLEYERSVQDTLAQAVQCYQETCRLSPSDAMFQHNLGWLYWKNQQSDSALFYVSRAIELEPNMAVYYISKGLMLELKNPDEAFGAYKQAVLLSPDIIDSPFFNDLKGRNPVKTGELLKNASNELLEMLSVRYSSIIEAKSGKLLLSLGENDRAYETLSHVTQIHPNLNRPWYYLGYIEQKRGNFEAMQIAYKKSLYLSPSDYLPLYALSSYYQATGDTVKSDSYYKSAEKAYKNKRSVHSIRSKRMYYQSSKHDDVIPQGFLNYISPVFQTQALMRIENIHNGAR